MSGCSGGEKDGQQAASEQRAANDQPLDLTGSWRQTNSGSDESWMEAEISGDTITINWAYADGTTALYWVGTYVAPTDATDTYTWTSQGDTGQMSSALLASGDDAKEFSYSGGKLSFQASMVGVTATVEMERGENA